MRRLNSGLTRVLAVALVGSLAAADHETTPDTPGEAPPAPPEFLYQQPPIPEMLLKDKREGRYMTGFPAIGWDPETQLTLGAAIQLYSNGDKESPFFLYSPYRQRIGLGVAVTTSGYSKALVFYDQPYISDTPWRIRGGLTYIHNPLDNYFGYGTQTLDKLSYPGSPKTYDRYEPYYADLSRNVNGETWTYYNNYEHTTIGGVLTAEYTMLGGHLRPQAGLQIVHIDTDDYTGERDDGATMQTTLLRNDYNAGNVLGFGGGWDNAIKVGLTYDTRDFEPDPNQGVMLQATLRWATGLLGSDNDYGQATISGRFFHNLLHAPKRLIAAGRLTYAAQWGDTPFYSAAILPFTDGDVTGLGSFPTLRGFNSRRFVGDAAMFANLELRWGFAETILWNQHLRFSLAPFIDTGRVFDDIGATTLRDWKIAGGAGLRLAWNLATIISFDYAYSQENSAFYMEIGQAF